MNDPDRGFDARLRRDDVTFGRADAKLLRAVEETGSLAGAAESLGRSRPRVGTRVDELEAAFGPLVERQRGGRDGGGTRLTDPARDLLARYDRLHTAFAGLAEIEETVLEGRVVDRDGELATVETAAGQVRALVPSEADHVDVTLRADAITLQDPADTPAADATSARNRLLGRVVAVDRGERVIRVQLDVGAEPNLVALVTADSANRLDLTTDRQVVATFKATATRATPK